MKIKTIQRKTVQYEVEVDMDDRLYQNETPIWKIANIILDNKLDYLTNDLYNEEDRWVVETAAKQINEAFAKAEKIYMQFS